MPATDALTSWEKAVSALRYAVANRILVAPMARAVVCAADLGPYELLAAQLRSGDIRGVDDIDALDRLATDAATVAPAARGTRIHHQETDALVPAQEKRSAAPVSRRLPGPARPRRVSASLWIRRRLVEDHRDQPHDELVEFERR